MNLRTGMAKHQTALKKFLAEARAYHPDAQSPHFATLAAYRAELLYGIDAQEAYRKIIGRRKRRKSVLVQPTSIFTDIEEAPRSARHPVDIAFDRDD